MDNKSINAMTETFDQLAHVEPEPETPVIPIGELKTVIPKRDDSGAARQKDRDNRKKLGIISDQVVQHARAKKLNCIIFSDGDTPGMVSFSGHYSEALVRSLVLNLYMRFHDTFMGVIEEIDKAVKQQTTTDEQSNEGGSTSGTV